MEKLFHGVNRFEYKDGYNIPLRFTKFYEEYLSWNERLIEYVRSAASVTIEIETNATNVSFDYKLYPSTATAANFTAIVNGVLVKSIEVNGLSEGKIEFDFTAENKIIEIYFPFNTEVGIKNFTVSGDYKTVNTPKQKVLFFGDSITQGARANLSSQSYVNVVKRNLNYEILNFGINGYVFDKSLVTKTNFSPDKIIVSLGTNNSHASKESNEKTIKDFFEALDLVYKNVPVLCIIPIWCGNTKPTQLEEYKHINKLINKFSREYANIKVVSGYDLIPHEPKYFGDDLIHPNQLGMETYGNNLTKAIKEIGF